MRLSSGILHAWLFALFIGLAAQTAVPHVHAPTEHQVNVCAGHLEQDDTANGEHAGSCMRCRLPNRTRLFTALKAMSFGPVISMPTAAAPVLHGPIVRMALAIPHERAPPALRS